MLCGDTVHFYLADLNSSQESYQELGISEITDLREWTACECLATTVHELCAALTSRIRAGRMSIGQHFEISIIYAAYNVSRR